MRKNIQCPQQLLNFYQAPQFNLNWTRKLPKPSKNLVLKHQVAIFPKLCESDKLFIARSKEYKQGFQFDFFHCCGGNIATLAPDFEPKPCMPRVSDCNSVCFKPCFGRIETSEINWQQTETGKTENLQSKNVGSFGPALLISETSDQYFVKIRAR